jgi:uncharacterized protein
VIVPALVTLVMGTILGYLAQRSRICFIGGLRDFLLVRDTELLKGAIAFFVTAFLAFSAASALGLVDLGALDSQSNQPGAALAVTGQNPGSLGAVANAILPGVATRLTSLKLTAWLTTIIAGLALGLFSTLANGCPTRQHVLAAQGSRDSLFYLAGFYVGVFVFYLATKPLLALLF